VVVDAGGGTIDISAYGQKHIKGPGMMSFEEISAAQCAYHLAAVQMHRLTLITFRLLSRLCFRQRPCTGIPPEAAR